ncbi:hypothetical protein [Pseudomonas kurunegalensis]|uniref:DUF6957 family protein n=1 Tax=Pseudomonas kurunegalensis TaxID=485880 RepID=UPI00355845FC
MTGATFFDLDGVRRQLYGLDFSREEAIATAEQRWPLKAYCVVEDWTIFRVGLNAEELKRVHAAGHLPFFMFAHKVVEDSQHRFQPGDWVRSSMCTAFTDGVFFETRNTVYVLLGQGHEQTASLKAIFSFF